MTEESLLALAERCEKVTGPDRELDALILAEIENRDVRYDNGDRGALLAKHRSAPFDECVLGWADPGKAARNFTAAPMEPQLPLYTASLDAALTLVPEGLIMALTNCDADGPKPVFGKASAIVGNPDDTGEPVVAATMALALSAASLKARAKAAQ